MPAGYRFDSARHRPSVPDSDDELAHDVAAHVRRSLWRSSVPLPNAQHSTLGRDSNAE
jgi:hypothetical protein